MNILVFNCGSSSLNYKLFAAADDDTLQVVRSGKAHRVGVRGSQPSFIEHHHGGETRQQVTPIPNHREAATLALHYLQDAGVSVDAVGHRFVHGGSLFRESVRLTPQALARLQELLPLAPIHNPNSLSVIEVCRAALPGTPQYLTFDTAFHAGLAPEASTYALPRELREGYGLRKYGFHGLSYQFVTQQAARFLERPLEELRLVACHLGTGGSSVAAVAGGRSVDTSMGYSPLAGLVMSTRTGDLDPLLPTFLMEKQGYSAEQLTGLFNKQSGLLGLSGFSSDLRDLIHAMDEEKNARAALAFELYTYRLKKTIGGFAALLGGMDALIFTDDIGVQNWRVRQKACEDMQWCGVRLERAANEAAPAERITLVSAPDSPVKVLSVPTDEERVIGMEGVRLFKEASHATH